MAEREKIVAEFFRRGHLLSDGAISQMLGGYEQFLDKPLPLVVEGKDLQQPPEYRIIKSIKQPAQVTTEDFANFYKSKYEKMRSIITARVQKEFVSLNKIDAGRGEVHVLGMVKEIKEHNGKKIIELEDTTATVPVIFDPTDLEDVELDDVIAVRAVAGGRVLYGKKIIYPDMPLRQPTKGHGRGCFVSDLRLHVAPTTDAERFFAWFSQTDIPYLFVTGELGDKELFEKYVERYCYLKTVFVSSIHEFMSSRIVSLSDPAMMEAGGLKILLIGKGKTHDAPSMHRFVLMLKKRHLGGMITGEDQLVLDEIPDIMHTGGEAFVSNYKSVTLVSSGTLLGDFRPVVVDFATRDVEKISLGMHEIG